MVSPRGHSARVSSLISSPPIVDYSEVKTGISQAPIQSKAKIVMRSVTALATLNKWKCKVKNRAQPRLKKPIFNKTRKVAPFIYHRCINSNCPHHGVTACHGGRPPLSVGQAYLDECRSVLLFKTDLILRKCH